MRLSMLGNRYDFPGLRLRGLPGWRQRCSPASRPARELSGVWLGGPVPPLEIPPPMTARGQALFDAAKPMYGSRSVPVVDSDDPLVNCDPLGMPRSVLHETRGVEFMQAPDKVVLLQQYQRVFREVWTDGRKLPPTSAAQTPTRPLPPDTDTPSARGPTTRRLWCRPPAPSRPATVICTRIPTAWAPGSRSGIVASTRARSS